MYILGISCFYHDSSACLIKDGIVVAAVQEERLNRVKASSSFPIKSINYCLSVENITIDDIEKIVFYEKPYLKFERFILDHLKYYPFSFQNFYKAIPNWLNERLVLPILLKERFGYDRGVVYIPHHLSHAGSSFFSSNFEKAAIITIDGVGEWATTTIGVGEKNKIKILKEINYPNSLGLLYSSITTFLGFSANTGEGKVMAYASYGKPTFIEQFKKIIEIKLDGSFILNKKYFNFGVGNRMYTSALIKLFGQPRKNKDNQKYFDIAATLQFVLEDVVLKIAKEAYRLTKCKNICLAGGVFLNCVVNSKILKETQFEDVFIQPASGDAGGSLGAALTYYYQYLNNSRKESFKNAYLGPSFSEYEILKSLRKNNLKFKKINDEKMQEFIIKKVADNKIIGIFKNKMEFGPRALGNRSILASVTNKKIKDYLNTEVKHREWFRPYGIIILKEEQQKYFDLKLDSPYMLLVGNVNKKLKNKIPSALHVDDTSRIQTITKKNNSFLHELLKKNKQKNGVGIMINTSFNDNNEPIVCTPNDAIKSFLNMKIDYLVMDNFLIKKDN